MIFTSSLLNFVVFIPRLCIWEELQHFEGHPGTIIAFLQIYLPLLKINKRAVPNKAVQVGQKDEKLINVQHVYQAGESKQTSQKTQWDTFEPFLFIRNNPFNIHIRKYCVRSEKCNFLLTFRTWNILKQQVGWSGKVVIHQK